MLVGCKQEVQGDLVVPWRGRGLSTCFVCLTPLLPIIQRMWDGRWDNRDRIVSCIYQLYSNGDDIYWFANWLEGNNIRSTKWLCVQSCMSVYISLTFKSDRRLYYIVKRSNSTCTSDHFSNVLIRVEMSVLLPVLLPPDLSPRATVFFSPTVLCEFTQLLT